MKSVSYEYDDEDDVEQILEMNREARRNIEREVREIRATEDLQESDDIDVSMWHNDVDDWEAVDAVEHRAEAARQKVAAWRSLNEHGMIKMDGGGPA